MSLSAALQELSYGLRTRGFRKCSYVGRGEDTVGFGVSEGSAQGCYRTLGFGMPSASPLQLACGVGKFAVWITLGCPTALDRAS